MQWSIVLRRPQVELLLPLRAATVSTAPDAELSVEIDVDLGHGQQRGSSRRGFDSRADTRDRVEIGPVYSPTHDVSVLRDEARHAVIRFDGPLGPREPDLRAFWTTTRSAVGATLLTYWPEEEARGYFLLVAQPSRFESVRLETRPKDLTFVIDTSGSMDGDRLEQVRLVLEAQVEALDAQDRLNVVAYGDTVRKLWPEPRSLEGAARAQALRFVRALEAGGGTNVDAALATALAAPRSPERSAVVVFVTDGRPTRGETSHTGILDHVRQANAKHPARVFGLGLGVDVDSVLLDRLALENGGLPAYVRPRADARPALEALLRAFDEPVLARVALALRGIGAEDVLPERLPDVVRGGTLFVTGRYAREGRPEIVLGEREGRVRQEYGTLLWAGGPGDVSLGAFPARIWALRRIAAHVDALRLRTAEAPGRVRELVTLSTRHGLLTEYTAFLADEGADHTAHAANVALAAKMLADYRTPGVGALGLAQAMNQAARRDALRAPPRAEGGWLPDSGGRTISRVRWPGVRQVGELAWFYRRGVGWVDARVPDTGVVDAEVARWTPAFFELLETTSAQENAGLAQSGPVLIRVGERTVRVVD